MQFGTPREICENPVSIHAASRLGQPRINILPADAFAGAPARAAFIGLRPEQIAQDDSEDSFVACVEHLGDLTRLHLKFTSHDLITVTDAHSTLTHGDVVRIQPRRPFDLDAAGARLA